MDQPNEPTLTPAGGLGRSIPTIPADQAIKYTPAGCEHDFKDSPSEDIPGCTERYCVKCSWGFIIKA